MAGENTAPTQFVPDDAPLSLRVRSLRALMAGVAAPENPRCCGMKKVRGSLPLGTFVRDLLVQKNGVS
jgi:hypothetical protein